MSPALIARSGRSTIFPLGARGPHADFMIGLPSDPHPGFPLEGRGSTPKVARSTDSGEGSSIPNGPEPGNRVVERKVAIAPCRWT